MAGAGRHRRISVAVTAEQVRELRERTGAGLMDCKRALESCSGDMTAAIETLRKHGIDMAAKRESKAAKQGIVEAYVHAGGKIGVLVEVNCETDFVARTEDFTQFARDVAMQVAAQHPQYLVREDVPETVVEKEKEIYREQMANEKKPPQVIEKIVEGKLQKYYKETCLMEQAFIKDPDKSMETLRKELAGKLGENIQVRRFVRFQLGEEA